MALPLGMSEVIRDVGQRDCPQGLRGGLQAAWPGSEPWAWKAERGRSVFPCIFASLESGTVPGIWKMGIYV